MPFPAEYRDLLAEDSKALLFLATLMRDGSPQLTPVWFSTDGEYILINTNEGRIKDMNMKQRPRVAMVILDPNDDYRYLGMRGEVISYTTEGADEHIHALSRRYKGEEWEDRPDQRRITFKIRPTSFDPH